MSKLEETILSATPLKPTYYKRFIDDIFILWPHSIADLHKFISSLNNYHPLIKFTSEHDYAFKHKHRKNLLKRGYSNHFISQYTNNIRFKSRSLAFKSKLKTNKRRLAFNTRFTSSAAKAMKIIKRFWPSPRNSKTFQHANLPPPTLTFTSNRSLVSHQQTVTPIYHQ